MHSINNQFQTSKIPVFQSKKDGSPPRILLAGVFGPYGVDDDFGRKENVMELFHNQVTKVQGAASFRFHHRSFGLYFLAENINADVTVHSASDDSVDVDAGKTWFQPHELRSFSSFCCEL